MESIKPKLFLRIFIIPLLVSLFLIGCSPKPKAPEDVLNTPEHHVLSGFKLLEKDYLLDAKREFKLALQLDPYYCDAYRGLGLIYGREKGFDQAFASMRSAIDYAKTGREKGLVYVGLMRLYTMQKDKGWLDEVKEQFSYALRYKKELPEAYYYMGVAYKEANRVPASERAFKRVLEINKGLVTESKRELESLGNPGQ